MKKIGLGLFLMMSMAAFSAPNFVDVNRIRKDGYTIYQDIDSTFAFTQETNESRSNTLLFQ